MAQAHWRYFAIHLPGSSYGYFHLYRATGWGIKLLRSGVSLAGDSVATLAWLLANMIGNYIVGYKR